MLANVGDEGGFAPSINSNEDALSLIIDAIESAKLTPGKDISICLDVAANELIDKNGKYHFAELPKNVKDNGHYGEELKSFIQYAYHGLRRTEGLVEAFLNDFGFNIQNLLFTISLLMRLWC